MGKLAQRRRLLASSASNGGRVLDGRVGRTSAANERFKRDQLAEHVVASDVSPRAVRFTEFNVHLNGLAGRVTAHVSDVFASLEQWRPSLSAQVPVSSASVSPRHAPSGCANRVAVKQRRCTAWR